MMNLSTAIEKYLNRTVDFTTEVILKDNGDGSQYIYSWNVTEAQPTLTQLQTLYTNNKTALDIDAVLRGGGLVKVTIDSGTSNTYATGYMSTLNVTQADWNTYLNYIGSKTNVKPTNVLTTESVISVKATPCPTVTTRYINDCLNTSLDNTANMVIFNNNNKNVNVYLPTITASNHGFIFYIKNVSRNANVYIYPVTAANLIDNSSGLALNQSRGIIIATCYNTQTYMILGSY